MLVIISPAKSLDFSPVDEHLPYSEPVFQDESEMLMNKLSSFSKKKLRELMGISDKLADLNYNRCKKWEKYFKPGVAKQALLAFNGEVFNGLQADSFSISDLEYAQEHLRILSGLHGFLRPLDLIRPYRLEMGIELRIRRKANLYQFWGDKIHHHIKNMIEQQDEPVLINLASNEYAKVVQLEKLPYRVITPVFKELRGDEYKQITIYFKKARGLLTSFILKNKLETPDEIKLFDYEGYGFHEALSTENEWVFTR